MKKLFVLILAVCAISNTANAIDWNSYVAKVKEYVGLAITSVKDGSFDPNTNYETKFLFCTAGSAAYWASAEILLCKDTSGTAFQITALGAGWAGGISGSVNAVLVRYERGDSVVGHYKGGSVGLTVKIGARGAYFGKMQSSSNFTSKKGGALLVGLTFGANFDAQGKVIHISALNAAPDANAVVPASGTVVVREEPASGTLTIIDERPASGTVASGTVRP